MRFIELFGGIGGFRKGIEQATDEWRCVWYNDNDKYAVTIYNKNFDEDYKPKNIREVDVDDIPEFEVLTAGFPCQSFSVAGKQRGFEDTRGTLFFEIGRVLQQKQPPFFILENVRGLLSNKKGQTFKTILDTLDELGYDCQWQVLNSKDFGVPQNRERVFIVGHLRRQRRPEIFPLRESNQTNLRELTQGVSQADRVYDTDGLSPTIPTSGGGRHEPKVLFPTTKEGNSYCLDSNYHKGLANPKKCNRTQVIDGKSIRKLTPIECERLQGFPDNWTKGVSDTQRYKLLGNAVTTNVVEAIIREWR